MKRGYPARHPYQRHRTIRCTRRDLLLEAEQRRVTDANLRLLHRLADQSRGLTGIPSLRRAPRQIEPLRSLLHEHPAMTVEQPSIHLAHRHSRARPTLLPAELSRSQQHPNTVAGASGTPGSATPELVRPPR